ncbi:insulin-like growth factor-binding protein complex acid labile subunit [Branchiostoma lanceolatum]|uniref:insulin-like growth factor-binding protein complex acid labile subunit n=1 Tax=Branchiostoma lanceolatum TaxID=7740 RepID=UPI00345373FA
MMFDVQILTLFCVATSLTGVHACPPECTCFHDVPSVHCNAPTLDHIPRGIPSNTTLLQMKGTQLRVVRKGDLAGLPLLKILYLFNNKLQTIEVGAFDDVPAIVDIEIGNNQISDLPPGVFRGCGQLQTVAADGNPLTKIRQGVFNDLPKLQEVRFTYNHIETIEVGAFSNLSNSMYLGLQNNQIRAIRKGAFGAPVGAKQLQLQNNNISFIESGALSAFSEISTLTLDNNEISSLTGALQGLGNTDVISLKSNQIVALDENTFQGLHKLSRLDISSNHPRAITGKVFANLSSLNFLDLHNNMIVKIDSTLPNGIEQLVLSANQISAVTENTFKGLRALQSLDLSDNQLGAITGQVFANLSSLKSLNLHNNKLVRMDSPLPNGIGQVMLSSNLLPQVPPLPGALDMLDLSHNPLESLVQGQFSHIPSITTLGLSGIKYFIEKGTIDAGVFTGLGRLGTLNLADNNLTRVPSEALGKINQLETLNLSGNEIPTLNPNDFVNMTNITRLDLSGNNLTSVPEAVFDKLIRMYELDLSDNPIVFVGPRAFSKDLAAIHLDHTKLRIIDETAFNESVEVKWLRLNDNYLQFLPGGIYKPLTFYGDLMELEDMTNNPWTCDCQMYEYAQYVRSPAAFALHTLECAGPGSLKGQILRKVPLNTLKCDCPHTSTPTIDTRGSSTVVPTGHRAVLKCQVTACPEAAVIWTTPTGVSLTSDSQHPGLSVLSDGSLVVVSASSEDSGTYSCMAANYLGKATATVNLRVTNGPQTTTDTSVTTT